ncbi:MAG: tail fiber domain-containing protein, partial [Bacteriovorax sp.]
TDPSVSAFAKAALPTCLAGEVLKSDGTSLSCVTDNTGAGSYTGTQNRVVITDGATGALATSTVTNTEIGYVSGVTSAIQTQINSKQATITSSTALTTGSVQTNLQGAIQVSPFNTAAGNTGEFRFYELAANGTNYTGFKSPDNLAANLIYVLPASAPSAGNVLSSDGSGNLSWMAIPSAPVSTVFGRSGAVISASGDYTATQITNTPAGNITSTTIQAALNELDSKKQGIDATLTSLAAYNTNGILVQTAADTFAGRSIAGTANRVSVTNGDGVAGNPTINLDTTLFPSPLAGDAGKFLKTTGANASLWTALATSDITTALGFTPINKTGDSLTTGTIALSGTAALTVQNPVNVLDAANKQYVDGFGQWIKGTGANAGDIYRASGNVGIGTTTPSGKFQVNDSTATNAAGRIISSTTNVSSSIQSAEGTNRYFASPTSGLEIVTTTNHPISFGVNQAGSGTPSMMIATTGNVGIGTTAPTAALDVGPPSSGTVTQRLQAGSSQYLTNLLLSPSTHATSRRAAIGIDDWYVLQDINGNGTKDFSIWQSSAPAHRFYIGPTGNVGIGTTTPGYLTWGSGLTVQGSTNLQGKVEVVDSKADLNSNEISHIGFIKSGYSSANQELAAITVNTNGTTAGNRGGDLIFHTRANGAATAVGNMIVTGGGNIGIGTVTPSGTLDVHSGSSDLLLTTGTNNDPTLKTITGTTTTWTRFNMGGALAIFTGGTDAGANIPSLFVATGGNVGIGTATPGFTLDVNGSIAAVGALQAHSDRKLKKNIVKVDNSLEKLLALNGVYFDWRKDEFPQIHFEGGRQIGVIAQDVEKVFPEAVSKNKEGIRSVAYTMLIAPMIEAFKEINKRITELFKASEGHSRDLASVNDKTTKLEAKSARLEAENVAKDKKINKLEQENAAIKARLEKIEKALNSK